MISIADTYGFFWETLWNHSENSTLKENRKDPNILCNGDLVFVPDLRRGEVSCACEDRHRFRKKNTPAKLRLRLLQFEEPRSNMQYVLDVDGTLFEGSTDADGWLEEAIPPSARHGVLRLTETGEEYGLDLGGVEPIDETSGVQTRLRNLSYPCPTSGAMDEATSVALKQFQVDAGLPETGQIDAATKDALLKQHGR